METILRRMKVQAIRERILNERKQEADLMVTELRTLIDNFLKDTKKITRDNEIRERISKLASDFSKVKQPNHVPGEGTINKFSLPKLTKFMMNMKGVRSLLPGWRNAL